jgi:hypothetical protein
VVHVHGELLGGDSVYVPGRYCSMRQYYIAEIAIGARKNHTFMFGTLASPR